MRKKAINLLLFVASAAFLLLHTSCSKQENAAPEKPGTTKVQESPPAPKKAEPAPGSILVTGALVYPSGAPAKGQTVIVMPLDAKGQGRIEFGFLNDQGLFGMTNPAGQTDDQGNFAISLPHDLSVKGRRVSRFTLCLGTTGYPHLRQGRADVVIDFNPKAETGKIDLGQLTVPSDLPASPR